MKPSRTPSKKRLAIPPSISEDHAFAEVLDMIRDARTKSLAAVNMALVNLYGRIGGYISGKLAASVWGERTVEVLAQYIAHRHPGLRGFTRANLFRMRQFHDAYQHDEKVATVSRQLSWSHNVLILGRCKQAEEREFYLRMGVQRRWSVREMGRQMDRALFERAVLDPPKTTSALKQLHPDTDEVFRDAYLVEFLDLPDRHLEVDLHQGLLRHLRRFMAELGHDFCFMGSEVPLQVGTRDFALDLLFYHRGLCCLVAIELKVGQFEPEHLGKLEFYLEALDRDVRKPNEGPSIGMLLCATKDDEVVEYALSRSMSPALVAQYQTQLPDRKLLQERLRQLYTLTEIAEDKEG